MAAEIAQWYNSVPILTRTLITATVATTGCYLVGLVNPYLLLLHWPELRKAQFWRLLTCFFLHGKGISFLFNLFFLYSYSIKLESDTFAGKPAEYLHYLLFTGIFSLTTGLILRLPVLTEALLLSIILLWSKKNPQTIVTFFFGMQFKAFYLPYVLLGFDFLTSGSLPVVGLIGVAAGHAYMFVTDPIYGAPSWCRRWLGTPPSFLYQWMPNRMPRFASFSASSSSSSSNTRPSVTTSYEQGSSTGTRRTWGKGYKLGDS